MEIWARRRASEGAPRRSAQILVAGLLAVGACHNSRPIARDAGRARGEGHWQLGAVGEPERMPPPGTPRVGVVGPVGHGTPDAGETGGQGPSRTASAGTIAGVVRSVDVAAGRVTVEAGGGAVALRGRPDQLDDLRPGQRLQATYQTFGVGVKWLTTPSAAGARTFGQPGRATGTVASVDEVDGTVRVGGRLFHAHPAQLKTLMVGQVVTIWFRQLDGQAWMQWFAAATTVHSSP